MSTKIYNAYLWAGTIEELINFFHVIRQEYIKQAVEHLIKFHKWFDAKEKEEKEKQNGYFNLQFYLQAQIRKGLNEPDNIDASMMVYFHQNKIAFQTFGLELFIEKQIGQKDFERPLRNMVENHPKTKFYGYWNNVDPDESCSDEEWVERENFWDFLEVPSTSGLVYELSNSDTLWRITSLYDEQYKERIA